MAGIQNVPLRIPAQWSPEWFETFVREVLSKLDTRNAIGVGVGVSSDGNSVATLDVSTAISTAIDTHEADTTDVHSAAKYAQTDVAETITGAWNLDNITIDRVVIGPGNTTTASIKLTSQAAGLTSVEQGAIELVGNSLQFTQLLKRRGVAMTQSVLTTDTTLTNSTAESAAVITAEHGPNYLEVGKCEEIILRGVLQQAAAGSGRLQVRVKYAGVTVQTIQTNVATIAANTPFEIRVTTTVRSIGATGTMQVNGVLWIDGLANAADAAALVTIDTTSAEDTTVTLQWTYASASNVITVSQGRVLCIEPNR